MNALWAPLFGLFCVIIGIVLNELIRRSMRVEIFAPKIFEKRLEKHEELMELIQVGYEVASDVMTNSSYSAEERLALISEVVGTIAEFVDREVLFLDPDLAAHCVAAFMGAEEVLSIEDLKERSRAEDYVGTKYMEAKRMIREESGVRQVERLFRKIHKPRLQSPVIDRIKYLRKHPKELKRLREGQGGV